MSTETDLSLVTPLKWEGTGLGELTEYLGFLKGAVHGVIVIDGSSRFPR